MNNIIRRDEEANGRPKRRRNSGGKKPKARKRGGGGNGGNAKASYRDYRRGTGVDHKKKASIANSSRKISSKNLQSIECSSSSIMRGWKQELGALIRYYVHQRCRQGVTQELAEKEVEQIYYDQGCGKDAQKAWNEGSK